MLRGIHSSAKNEWLIKLCENKTIIVESSMPDRVRILEKLAENIHGIGPTTIDETLVWYESYYPHN